MHAERRVEEAIVIGTAAIHEGHPCPQAYQNLGPSPHLIPILKIEW